jgi:SAM-dependent methyltransferase
MDDELGPVAFWESLYAERDRIWSGRPNRALVAAAEGLPAGRALDVGCGEGADAVWLAEQGWEVTAVDIAAKAVERARAAAAGRPLPADRIEWVVADLASWAPMTAYDLVSACFLHSPVDFPRAEVLRRGAAAVAPAGHLLVVGHAAPPPWARGHHEGHRFPTPDSELADLCLEPSAWDVLVADVRPRDAVGPDGVPAVLDDTVVLARRR